MKKSTTSVSVILPTYNEAENIVPLIREIISALRDFKTDILVVDDNSPDATSDRVRYAILTYRWRTVRVLTRSQNRGLVNSIRDGIKNSKGDIVLWMDCDFSMPPALLPSLVLHVTHGYDAAVGSRFALFGKQKVVNKSKGDSGVAVGLSTILNKSLRYLFRFDFHDYTSGFIAVRRDVLLQIPLRGDYGEYFIDFMARFFFKGYKAIEIPYQCAPRRYGTSKTGANIVVLTTHGMRYIWAVCRIIIEKGMGYIYKV